MPRFDKTKRYINIKGQTFGKGIWLDNSGNIIYPGIGYEVNRKTRNISQYNSDGTITKYPWEDWAKKKVKEGELPAQSDLQSDCYEYKYL